MKKSKNELQQAIKALMDYYGIEDFNFYHQGAIFISEDDGFSYKLADVLYRGISDYCYNSNLRRELAMLIQLLRSCKDSELTIKGKITHPHNNEIKGTEKEVTLTCVPFLQDLELILNNYLSADGVSDRLCLSNEQRLSNPWIIEDNRTPIIIEDPCWKRLLTGLYAPYTDTELQNVVSVENKIRNIKFSQPVNYKLGLLAHDLLSYIDVATTKFNTRKKFSFLYDAMLLGGFVGKKPIIDKGFSGDIGREKAQKVKDWLKAYEKDHNKFDPSKKW